jgi:hypothetical protein
MPGVSGIGAPHVTRGGWHHPAVMKTTTVRAATPEERVRLAEYLMPSRPGKPAWLGAVLVGVPATFALFVVLNTLLDGVVPSVVRLGAALAIGGAGAWTFGKREAARYEEAFRPAPEIREAVERDLASGSVSVARWEIEAIVKVAPDRARFVRTSWFARLADGSVVLLVAPELEELELAGGFPARALEIATGEASRLVASVARKGETLASVATRAPLSDAEWEELGDDVDGSVPLGWPEILERAARNPLTAATRRRQAEERAAIDRQLDEIVAATEQAPTDPTRPR